MGKKNNSNTEVEKLDKNMEFENLDVAFSVDYFGADYRSPIYFPGNEKTAPAITSSYSPFQTIIQANDAAYHARMCMQSSTPENIANFYNTILTDVIEDKICYELGANINIILYNGICNLIRMYIIKDGFINEMLYDLTHAHRYIYDAVKHGHEEPIPEHIAVGIDTTKPNLLERRSRWNERTPEPWNLPTEIWRETVERLQRYENIRQKIEGGEIKEINDFITYNLDIRNFVYDYLQNTEDHLFVIAHQYKM